MTELQRLFEEEEKVQRAVREIAEGLLDLSEFVAAKSAVELASAESAGKRLRNACDMINEEVHLARKSLGVLMSKSTKVRFKGSQRALHEMEDELALIHGDVEAIGALSLVFYRAPDRSAAFENLNKHYSDLVQHVTDLMMEEGALKGEVK